jgi:hypothetical protein
MGSRGEFLRAMLLGIVIGVAITTAFFQLRAPAPTNSPSPNVTIEPVAVDAAP